MDPRTLPGGPVDESFDDRPDPSIGLRLAAFFMGLSGAVMFFLLMAEGFPSTVTPETLVRTVGGYFLVVAAFIFAAGLLSFRTWAWYASLAYLVVTVGLLLVWGQPTLYPGILVSGELEIAGATVGLLLLVASVGREVTTGDPS